MSSAACWGPVPENALNETTVIDVAPALGLSSRIDSPEALAQALRQLSGAPKQAPVFSQTTGSASEQRVQPMGVDFALSSTGEPLQAVIGGYRPLPLMAAHQGLVWAELPQTPRPQAFSLQRAMQLGGLFIWPIFALGLGTFTLLIWLAFRFGGARPESTLQRAVRTLNLPEGLSEAALEHHLAEALAQLKERQARPSAALALIAAVTPMIGLLGTVTGMIGTFGSLATAGGQDQEGMASGISEALLTTQWGLLVAVVALLVQGLFLRWHRRHWEAVSEEAKAQLQSGQLLSTLPKPKPQQSLSPQRA